MNTKILAVYGGIVGLLMAFLGYAAILPASETVPSASTEGASEVNAPVVQAPTAPIGTGAILHTESYWKTQQFAFGERSDRVRELQDFLKTRGYFPTSLASTGYFGSVTNDAYARLVGYKLAEPVPARTSVTSPSSSGLDDFDLSSLFSDDASDDYPRIGCAENGSCYGDINQYGVPKTIHVDGYYRKDGTYVRGYYRGAPRY